MPKLLLSNLEHLVKSIVIPFYRVERHTPLRFAPGRYENDAEHSWSVALMASALAPQVDASLDVGKVCQFATVHDLVEVYAGDTSNFADASKKATKDQREEDALRRLRTELTHLPWITETIEAYEAQNSPEARFVKSVDKIIPLLFDYIEEGLFYKENKITLEEWKRHMQKHRQKASTHTGAFVYYDELWNALEANPHFFHKESK
jgi:5'-deoxynucleotidase YfbR-like HD superfamily hydrolase